MLVQIVTDLDGKRKEMKVGKWNERLIDLSIGFVVKWNDYVSPRISHGSGDLLILIVPFMQKTMPVKGDKLAALFDDWRPDEATLLDIVLNVMVPVE